MDRPPAARESRPSDDVRAGSSKTADGRFAGAVLREVLTASRFAVVGAIATFVHMGVVWVLVEHAGVPVFRANTIAYLCAFAVSFAGHHLWTFEANGSVRQRLIRFFIVSFGAFLLNSVILGLVLRADVLSPGLSALLAAAVVPLLTFVGSRFWGFRPSDSQDRAH